MLRLLPHDRQRLLDPTLGVMTMTTPRSDATGFRVASTAKINEARKALVSIARGDNLVIHVDDAMKRLREILDFKNASLFLSQWTDPTSVPEYKSLRTYGRRKSSKDLPERPPVLIEDPSSFKDREPPFAQQKEERSEENDTLLEKKMRLKKAREYNPSSSIPPKNAYLDPIYEERDGVVWAKTLTGHWVATYLPASTMAITNKDGAYFSEKGSSIPFPGSPYSTKREAIFNFTKELCQKYGPDGWLPIREVSYETAYEGFGAALIYRLIKDFNLETYNGLVRIKPDEDYHDHLDALYRRRRKSDGDLAPGKRAYSPRPRKDTGVVRKVSASPAPTRAAVSDLHSLSTKDLLVVARIVNYVQDIVDAENSDISDEAWSAAIAITRAAKFKGEAS